MNFAENNVSFPLQTNSGGTSSKARRKIRVPKAKLGVADFFAHLRSELTISFDEIANLASQLESISGDRSDLPLSSDHPLYSKLAATSRKAAGCIRSLSDLSTLLDDQVMPGDERLLLVDMFKEVSAEMAQVAHEHGVGLRLEDSNTQLEPVYASRCWVRQVLQQLIVNLIISSPAGSYLSFQVRQVGGHQLVSGTSQHAHPLAASSDLIPPETQQNVSAFTSATISKQLYLSIAHAVIELHGGMFKVKSTEDGRLLTFTFILPTGIPDSEEWRPECAVRPIIQR